MVVRQSGSSRRAVMSSGLLSAGFACWGAAWANGRIHSDANTAHNKLDAIGQTVEAEIRAGHAAGVSISVAKDGIIIWEAGFGAANKETATRATAHTPFSIASLTKTFTAAAVMRLVENGKLDLDAPIDRYLISPLPASSFDTKSVTPRLLGGHAAGLPTLFDMFDQMHPPKSTDLVHDYGELAYPPGERYEYANLGYNLLGSAVSRLTGHEFSKSLNDLVIRPIGLRDTFFDTDTERMRSAAGRYDKNGRSIPFYTTATPPSGEVYTSAHDLSIFAANLMGIKSSGRAPILGTRARDVLFAPVFTTVTKSFTTFGWSGRDVASERMIVKTGGQPGVSARLTVLPKRRISIAVISNQDNTRTLVANTSSAIASVLMSDWSNPDFQVDDVPSVDSLPGNYDGRWTGTIRNGEITKSLSILINSRGGSTCVVGDGSARMVQRIANHSPTLAFRVDGDLSPDGPTDGSVRQLDFKLVARSDKLVGRCLSACDSPGFTWTLPYVVALSKSP